MFDLIRSEPTSLFDRMFDAPAKRMSWPAVDVRDTGSDYRVTADLPGFAREDIQVSVEDGVLTLSAKRGGESEETRDGWSVRERWSGSFSRSFALPATIDSAKIEARYENGVLEVVVPKAPGARPRKIDVA